MTEILYDISRPEAVEISEKPLSSKVAAAREKAEAEAKANIAADAALQYRRDRAEAYRANLGQEASSIETIGDVLDAIIKHLRGDSAEFDAMTAKIDRIKRTFPKPK